MRQRNAKQKKKNEVEESKINKENEVEECKTKQRKMRQRNAKVNKEK